MSRWSNHAPGSAEEPFVELESVFHPGEIWTQRRLGVSQIASDRGRKMVTRAFTSVAERLVGTASFLAVAARDELGRPWASVLSGDPGFARVQDSQTLRINAAPEWGDPLARSLAKTSDIGLLAIEPATGRRLRANGIARPVSGAIEASVTQVFPNCRRFVGLRDLQFRTDRCPEIRRLSSLSGPEAKVVANANTFFLATGHGESREPGSFGMDVSHRGGGSGFVRVEDAAHLSFEDFPGNDLFSSIGNLVRDPRAGLLFIDFEQNDLIHLTGEIRVEWSGSRDANGSLTRRMVFEHHEGVIREDALSFVRRVEQ